MWLDPIQFSESSHTIYKQKRTKDPLSLLDAYVLVAVLIGTLPNTFQE